MTLRLRAFATPDALLEAAGPFLLAHEDESSLILGLLSRTGEPATVLVVGLDGDTPVLVAVQRALTRPTPTASA